MEKADIGLIGLGVMYFLHLRKNRLKKRLK